MSVGRFLNVYWLKYLASLLLYTPMCLCCSFLRIKISVIIEKNMANDKLRIIKETNPAV